jgi:hypothetical protein
MRQRIYLDDESFKMGLEFTPRELKDMEDHIFEKNLRLCIKSWRIAKEKLINREPLPYHGEFDG